MEQYYMSSTATDEQLAQGAVNLSNFMWSGPNQGMTELKEGTILSQTMSGNGAYEKMTTDWSDPIINNPNLFANGENTTNIDQWNTITENNFANYDGSGKVLETTTYNTYQTVSGTPTERIIDVTHTFDIDQDQKTTGGLKNGYVGVWRVTYVLSADKTKWVISGFQIVQ